jgi:hypothetical protein
VELKLLAEGTYVGKILDFDEPHESKIRYERFFMRIKVKVEGHVLTTYVVGYRDAIRMLYHSKPFWIGKDVQVQIRHREFGPENEKRIFPDTRILDYGKEV